MSMTYVANSSATQAPPWKSMLWPATFRGVEFHVEVRERANGRRIVVHEFAKKDIPYSEDMGRRAKRFEVHGYVVGPDYASQRDQLINALETEGVGTLRLPTMPDEQVVVDQYRVSERRERGGLAEFQMTFVEAGQSITDQITADTQGVTNAAADNAQSTAADTANGVNNATTTPPPSSFQDAYQSTVA
jgi:prophage DNA circulation protein